MGILPVMAIAGAMITGRVPGTAQDTDGPRLGARTAHVTTNAGIATTEIEDVVVNDIRFLMNGGGHP